MSVASIEYYEHDTACYEYMTFRAKGLGIIVHVETLSKKKKKLMISLKLKLAFTARC